MLKQEKPWAQSIENLLTIFGTTLEQGLNLETLKPQKILYGSNELPEKPRTQWWQLLIRQFFQIMIMLLFIALSISLFLGKYFDALAIGLMIVLNSVVGFIQEYSAEKALEALKKLTNPTARVTRNGKITTIPARDLIPGDIVYLDAGDAVPADGRVIQSIALRTQEAALTGESGSIEKNSQTIAESTMLADRKNMVFMGTNVTYGRGIILVTAIGIHTELGKIASMLKQEHSPKTPLQQQLNILGNQFVMRGFIFVGIAFIWGLLLGQSFLSQLLTSLSLAIAAIPEGLPLIVTIALAIGVKAMAKNKSIVRKLSAVETLGSVSVICTDKTGTLTKNEMTVQHIWTAEKTFSISGSGYNPLGSFSDPLTTSLNLTLHIGTLCNNAELHQNNGVWEITGDPTEAALIVAAQKADIFKKTLEGKYRFVWEKPFDDERKMMSVLRLHGADHTLFVKGAPDLVLQQSAFLQNGDQINPLLPQDITTIKQAFHEFASNGLRLIAVAYKKVPATAQLTPDTSDKDLIFTGFFALADTPRPEVFNAIKACKTAGIRIIMLTGDHKETALKIGRDLGIVDENAQVLEGTDLDVMSNRDLASQAAHTSIYARVVAHHKLRLVKALKANGFVVAMTGDGVNDAPAIKASDVGIAMGITGTEVTKQVADIIITDDNFASIVTAIRYGRGIYENIVKNVCYLISTNMAELLVVLFAMLLHFDGQNGQLFLGLLPIQLIWVNLITDVIPALALSVDKSDGMGMMRPPHQKGEKILSPLRATQSILVSCCVALATIGASYYGLQTSMDLGYTMALTTLIALVLLRAQMVRSEYNLSFFSNKWLIGAFVLSFLIHLGVLYTPIGNMLLKATPLNLIDWLVVLLFTIITWIIALLLQKVLIFWFNLKK